MKAAKCGTEHKRQGPPNSSRRDRNEQPVKRAARRTYSLPKNNPVRVATTAAGNLVLEGGCKGHHSDLAVACALAFLTSERLSGQAITTAKLWDYYQNEIGSGGVN